MSKKILFGVFALASVLVLLLAIAGCASPGLKDGEVLDNATCAKLDKVIVIHEAGCSACAAALPRLHELEQELNTSFRYYDIAVDKDKKELLSMNLVPTAVPILIVNCKVYLGAKSKEEFKRIIIS